MERDDNINEDAGTLYDYLAWGQKVSGSFADRVMTIGDEFGWSLTKVNYLMACMAFESAETFSPKVRNSAGSGATGLIQFMPATARALGTSVDELASMTAVEQLDYVKEYFVPYARRIRNLSDMYMAILYPRYVGARDDIVLFNKGTVAYRQNGSLDTNEDGLITKAECARFVHSKLDKGLGEGNVLIFERDL